MLPGQAFEFISNNLGAQKIPALSSRDIAGLSALSRAFDDLEVQDSDVITPTAIFAILPKLNKSLVRTEFGPDAESLFDKLQKIAPDKPGPFFISGMEIHFIVDAACDTEDENLSYAAQALLAGRVAGATYSEKKDLETALNNRDAAFRSILRSLREKVAAIEQIIEEPPKPAWVITFSIDIVGSTEGKTRMLAVTKDTAVLGQAYKDFHTSFMFQEERFYRRLLQPQPANSSLVPPPLEVSQLYIVKGIGDEIWGTYYVPSGDIKQLREATERFMLAGLDLVKGQVMWGAKETAQPFDYKTSGEERSDAVQHPLKMCIDFIEDGYEISKPRLNFFSRFLGQYLPWVSPVTIHDLLYRLNIAFSVPAGTRVIQSMRPDYLGHEIDRFFRVSKAATAMVVTMGESLFVKVGYTTKLTGYPGLFRADWSNTPGHTAQPLSHDSRLYIQEELSSEYLKGIGYSYRVYHFIERGQLGIFHNTPYHNPHLVGKTLKIFTKEMFLKLFTPAGRQRYEESVSAMAKKPPEKEEH